MVKEIVLVVDNAIIAMGIKGDLENKGYLVPLIANTLEEVLKESYEMDLMIMDIDFISTERIVEVEAPIIFLSSVHESLFPPEISTLQVTYDFLYKPFTKEELLHKTGKILSRAANIKCIN